MKEPWSRRVPEALGVADKPCLLKLRIEWSSGAWNGRWPESWRCQDRRRVCEMADTVCPSPKLAIASTVAWAPSRSHR